MCSAKVLARHPRFTFVPGEQVADAVERHRDPHWPWGNVHSDFFKKTLCS